MEHGAYRTEDAQGRIEQLEWELADALEAKNAAKRRTFTERHGPWIIVVFWLLMFAHVVWRCLQPDPPAEVRYRTVERTCTVEHAVKATVDEAVRRALAEDRAQRGQP